MYVHTHCELFIYNTMHISLLEETDGGDSEAVLSRFAQAGIDIGALGVQLQDEGIASFGKSLIELMTALATKGAALTEDQK